MKKYLKPIVALCLVLTLAIGGTIAYLTDETDSLTNSFTVDEDISLTLTENYDSFTLTPGTTQDKDPYIEVTGNTSYVFTEVVEMIPTAALSDGNYTFSNYVTYSINGLYVAPLEGTTTAAKAGGSIYSDGYVDGDSETTDWYWMLISTVTSKGEDTYTNSIDAYTTVTYVYALVDKDGNLLAVSSDDEMAEGTTPDYVAAEYPVLTGDVVTIPTTVTSAMMALLAVTESATDYYSVDLTFTGYAIQTEGLEALGDNREIARAAGATVSELS